MDFNKRYNKEAGAFSDAIGLSTPIAILAQPLITEAIKDHKEKKKQREEAKNKATEESEENLEKEASISDAINRIRTRGITRELNNLVREERTKTHGEQVQHHSEKSDQLLQTGDKHFSLLHAIASDAHTIAEHLHRYGSDIPEAVLNFVTEHADNATRLAENFYD